MPAFTDVSANKLGNKKYELTNHLGNVLAVITDRNLVTTGGTPSTYEAVVIMKSDYYPFGMETPGRNSNTSAYRFGYNGMESDKEVKGEGNSYTTEFRQYDPRLGRWMSLDPMMMSFPDESPYCAFADNPVYYTDPYGLDPGNGDKDKDGKSKGLAEGVSDQVQELKEWDPKMNKDGEWDLEAVPVKPHTGGTISSIVSSQREGIRSFADANEKAGNKGLATAIRVVGGIDIAIISKLEILDVANPKAYSNNYNNLPGDAIRLAIITNELKINPFTATVALGLAKKAQVLQKGNAQDISELVTSMLIDAALCYGGRVAAAAEETELNAVSSSEGSATGVRNGHLAGKTHPKTGVPFDKNGFPDFSNNLYKGGVNDVMIKPMGSRTADFAAANKVAGYTSTPKGYTWHHHQTTGRMQLVETEIHSKTGHTGGFSLW